MHSIDFSKFRFVAYASVLFAFFYGESVFAQYQNNAYELMLNQWEGSLQGYRQQFWIWTRRTFFSLMLIELVISGCIFAMQPGGGDVVAFGGFLLPRLLIFGFFMMIFDGGFGYAQLIVRSFTESGENVTGFSLTPDGILEHGLNLTKKMTKDASWWSGGKVVIGAAAMVAMILFAAIAANVMIAILEAYIVLTAGVITLAFLGSSYTREWGMGYFRFAIATGVKLLAMIILVGVGFDVLSSLFPEDAEVNGDKALALIGTLFLVYKISLSVPNAAAGMVAGHANGGMGFINANVAAMSNTLKSSASSAGGAIKAGYTAASSAKNAGKVGGGVMKGAGVMASTFKGEAVSSLRGDGAGASGNSMGQRVANSLRAQAGGQ